MLKNGLANTQRLIWLVIAVMVLATLACGTSEAPANQPETEAPATEEQTSGTVSLDIKNDGTTDICEVYVAAADDKNWGDDQLGEKKILVGETFTLNNIPEGKYDLQALDCDGNVIARSVKEDLSGSDFTWTIENTAVTLVIHNNSDSIGCKVYIAAPDDTDWGPNQVDEGETIDPGSTYTISGIDPGTYDIHAETCSGNYEWDWEDIDLTEDTDLNMNN